jgi:plasmid maintenance system killer protein
VTRVAKSKADIRGKKALHLIHGADVAQAIVAVHQNFEKVEGKRWLLTDLWVYDWWSLMFDWGGELEDGTDVREGVWWSMEQDEVKALPRGPEELGRVLDSRDFWRVVGALPGQGRVR